MDTTQKISLPFLTRTMLNFEQGAQISLVADVIAMTVDPIEIRGYTQEGAFTLRIVPVVDYTLQTFTFQLPNIPIAISAFLNVAENQSVTQYLTLHLAVNTNRMALLCQGPVTPIYGISWPNQHPTMPDQGQGDIIEIQGINPAAGTEIADTVPPLQLWELLGVHLRLVTDGTVANRIPKLVITTNSGISYRRVAGTAQTASQTMNYYFLPNGVTGSLTAGSEQEILIPEGIYMPTGTTIQTVTSGIVAGDNYASAYYIVRRRFTPGAFPLMV